MQKSMKEWQGQVDLQQLYTEQFKSPAGIGTTADDSVPPVEMVLFP